MDVYVNDENGNPQWLPPYIAGKRHPERHPDVEQVTAEIDAVLSELLGKTPEAPKEHP